MAGAIVFGGINTTLHAQSPAAEGSPAPAPAAAAAPAAPAATAEATLEQRITAIEAYFGNTDPAAAFKDLKVKKKNDAGEEVEEFPEGFK
jgi:hypothetical protein